MDWSIEGIAALIAAAVSGGFAAKIVDAISNRGDRSVISGREMRDELWKRTEKLEELVGKLREDIDRWQELYYEAKRQNELLKQENEMLKEMKERLEAENDELLASNDRLQEQQETMSGRIDELERRLKQADVS